MRVIVADASSLILSEKIGLLERVCKNNTIMIPMEVYRESVVKGKQKDAPDAHTIDQKVTHRMISLKEVKNEQRVQEIMKTFGTAKGETEAIALAMENKGALVLLDDHKAIIACKAYRMPFITSLTLVLMMLKERRITKTMAEGMIQGLALLGRYKYELISRALAEVKT